jgi:hypothetical protein
LDDKCSPGTPEPVAGNALRHFVVIRASKSKLHVIAVGLDGTVIDRSVMATSTHGD